MLLAKTRNKAIFFLMLLKTSTFLSLMALLIFLLLFHQAVVDGLLSKTTDNSLLISRFQEFLEMEDVRFYVMSSIRENVGKVMDKNKGVGELCSALSSSAAAVLVACFHNLHAVFLSKCYLVC